MKNKIFKVEGEDYKEVFAKRHGMSTTASRIYLPGSWTGRRVAVILLPLEKFVETDGQPKQPYTYADEMSDKIMSG